MNQRGIATVMRQQDEPVREGLRALRQHLVDARDEPRSEFHQPMPSRRPAHAVVALPVGGGGDSEALQHALKLLRRNLDRGGAWHLIRSRDSRLYQYIKPGERARQKSAKARARLRKLAKRRALVEARRDPAGRFPRRPPAYAPKKEVVVPAVAAG